jgi:exodeoxyribonuclease VII large subunit
LTRDYDRSALHPTANSAPSPLTPEILTEMIRLDAPQGVIAVQGYAQNLRSWAASNGRSFTFGELSWGAGLIMFRVPAETAPDEGDAVIIQGVLKASVETKGNAHSYRGNWRVELIGHVVGEWTPRVPQARAEIVERAGDAVSLEEFLVSAKLSRLLILSTETAQQDITRELTEAGTKARPQFLRVRFDDPKALAAIIENLPRHHSYDALAIARGGGGGLEIVGNNADVINALNRADVPYYSALGHATDVSLMDRYADQIFHSPTALGSRISQAMRANYRRQKIERETEDQRNAIRGQRKALLRVRRNVAWWRKFALGLGLVIMLQVAVLWQVVLT